MHGSDGASQRCLRAAVRTFLKKEKENRGTEIRFTQRFPCLKAYKWTGNGRKSGQKVTKKKKKKMKKSFFIFIFLFSGAHFLLFSISYDGSFLIKHARVPLMSHHAQKSKWKRKESWIRRPRSVSKRKELDRMLSPPGYGHRRDYGYVEIRSLSTGDRFLSLFSLFFLLVLVSLSLLALPDMPS